MSKSVRIDAPNYTQIPNIILDNLQEFESSELAILLHVCRKTYGWHVKSCKISISEFIEATGFSRQGVLNGVGALLDKEILGRQPVDEGYLYFLLVNSVDPPQSTQLTPPSQLSGLPPVNSVDCSNIKKGFKERVKESTFSLSADEPEKEKEDSPHKNFIKLWEEAYLSQFGLKYRFEGGRDAKAVKNLLNLEMPPDELLAIAQEAWKRGWDFECRQASTIHGFENRFNQIRVSLRAPINGYDKNERARLAKQASEYCDPTLKLRTSLK